MNHTIEVPKNTSNTWSLLRKLDEFGFGYIAQDSQFNTEATREGFEVMFTEMPAALAIKFRDIYTRAGCPQTELTSTPDLSDLLTFDMTLPQDERVSESAEEYDLVSVKWQGRVYEGVITFFDDTEIEIDGFLVMPVSHFLKHATLIAKADSDCGFVTEYTAYLTDQQSKWENLYAVALEAQNGIAA